MPYQKELNVFLNTIELPASEFIQQPEYEECLKNYLLLRVSDNIYKEKILPFKNDPEHVQKMIKIAESTLTDLIAESEECKFFQNRLIEVLYTNKGPRKDWDNEGDSGMIKCLEAGRFGLMQHETLVNKFLIKLELPEVHHAAQDEFGSTKHYLILRLTCQQWEEKINALKNNPEHIQNMRNIAKEIFVSSKF